MFGFSIVMSMILYICPPIVPAPTGINVGGDCGPRTVAPEGPTHNEHGRVLE